MSVRRRTKASLPRVAIRSRSEVRSTFGVSTTVAGNEALVLLGALAYGRGPRYAAFRADDAYRHAEAALKHAEILYSDYGPHHVAVSDDGQQLRQLHGH